MDSTEILIIVFCSFSACGLLLSLYLICKHKIALDKQIKLLQEIKNNKKNRVKPISMNYNLEYPQQEMKDENEEKMINITISSV